MRFENIFKRNEIQPVILKIPQYIILGVTGELTKYKSLATKEVVILRGRDTLRWHNWRAGQDTTLLKAHIHSAD